MTNYKSQRAWERHLRHLPARVPVGNSGASLSLAVLLNASLRHRQRLCRGPTAAPGLAFGHQSAPHLIAPGAPQLAAAPPPRPGPAQGPPGLLLTLQLGLPTKKEFFLCLFPTKVLFPEHKSVHHGPDSHTARNVPVPCPFLPPMWNLTFLCPHPTLSFFVTAMNSPHPP